MIRYLAALMFVLALVLPALAGPNDFFGSGGSPPGGMAAGGSPTGVGDGDDQPLGNNNLPKGTDFTSDEKRVRRKYGDNMKHAHELITKGKEMEKQGKETGDKKLETKGKILAESGRKALGDLEITNPNPSPDLIREKKERDANPSQLYLRVLLGSSRAEFNMNASSEVT